METAVVVNLNDLLDRELEELSKSDEPTPEEAPPPATEPVVPEPARKVGQRKANYDDETTAAVLKRAKSLVRQDHAGRDADEAIRQRLAADGVAAGPALIGAVRTLLDEQMAGCRKRISPRIDEAIRRLGDTVADEVYP